MTATVQTRSPEVIRHQLQRILASDVFVRGRRSAQLLRFLVEATLAGRENELKEYTIATAVFERPDSFDPRLDSVVRVEATRLRNRLQAYYATAGPDDMVEIALPVGSYAPTFRLRTSSGAPAESDSGRSTPVRLKRRRTPLAAAVALLAVAAGAYGVKRALFDTRPIRLALLQHLSIPGEVLLSPVMAHDLKSVYYSSNRDGGRLRIWRQQISGGPPQVLTPDLWNSYDLDVSSDGAWLSYYSTREGGGVYQQPLTGGSELLVASFGRSPRFSPDGKHVLFWVEDAHTGFGKVFLRRVSRAPNPEEPRQVAAEFADAHNPQWVGDDRVLLCGTLRTNVAEMEHDLWIVPTTPGAAPVKTGILSYLHARDIDLHSRALKATSFQFHNRTLIFAGVRYDRTALYALRLSGSFRPTGEPELLFEDANSQDNPRRRGNLFTFTSARSDSSVWRIPLRPDGLAAGAPGRLTDGPAETVFPAVSDDGRQLLYLALTSSGNQIWRKDLVAGVEKEVYRAAGINRFKAVRDGSQAVFRILEGPPPQLQALYSIGFPNGDVRRICENCGAPTSVSTRGEYVVHETGSAVLRLAVLHVPTGERREILRHSHHGVQSGRISPDGRWMLFELDRGPDGVQLFVAPFRGLEPVLEREWRAISDPKTSSYEPAWSADGSSIYFLSDQNGSRDLWLQRLDREKHPRGRPETVYRFSDPILTPLTYHVRHHRYVGLSVGRREAVLTLAELSSSVWISRLKE